VFPSAPSWPVLRWTLPLPLPFHVNIVFNFPHFYFSRRARTVHWQEKKLPVHLHITAVYRSIDWFHSTICTSPFISETSASALRTQLCILGSFYAVEATRAYIWPLNSIKCRSQELVEPYLHCLISSHGEHRDFTSYDTGNVSRLCYLPKLVIG